MPHKVRVVFKDDRLNPFVATVPDSYLNFSCQEFTAGCMHKLVSDGVTRYSTGDQILAIDRIHE